MSKNVIENFGIQSYCFRHFKDNRDVAKKVKEVGLNSIELCAVHVDFNAPETFDEVIGIYKSEGIDIVSIGVQTFDANIEQERNWFEFAKKAGAKFISAHFRVNNFNEAISSVSRLTKEYGIKLALHCHGGYMFGGSKDVVSHLLNISGGEVGLCLDTAWCMQTGRANPVKWAEDFSDKLYGIHFKDFTFNEDGSWNDVVVGEGNLDLKALVETVNKNNFKGYAVLEYEADVENPVPALKKCVESMRSLR
jgi:sugar phosphate isomerase/epimerase